MSCQDLGSPGRSETEDVTMESTISSACQFSSRGLPERVLLALSHPIADSLELFLRELGCLCLRFSDPAKIASWAEGEGHAYRGSSLAIVQFDYEGTCGVALSRRQPLLFDEIPVVFCGPSGDVTIDRAIDAVRAGALEVFEWPSGLPKLKAALNACARSAGAQTVRKPTRWRGESSGGPPVEVSDVPAEFHLAGAAAGHGRAVLSSRGLEGTGRFDPTGGAGDLTAYERQERAIILDALQQAEGHVVEAARLLGLGQATVYRKIKQYDIPRKRR